MIHTPQTDAAEETKRRDEQSLRCAAGNHATSVLCAATKQAMCSHCATHRECEPSELLADLGLRCPTHEAHAPVTLSDIAVRFRPDMDSVETFESPEIEAMVKRLRRMDHKKMQPEQKPAGPRLTISRAIPRLQIPGHALMYATTERA